MDIAPQLTAHYVQKKLRKRDVLFLTLKAAFIVLLFFAVQPLMEQVRAGGGCVWVALLCMNIMLYGGLVAFAAGTFFSYIFTYQGPAIVLDQHGLWVRHFNFIRWENVEKISPYTLWGTPTEVIGIRVKDVAAAYHNAERVGKIRIWWTKRFGSYHVNTFAQLDKSNEELMQFFQQHISKNHPHIVYELKQTQQKG